MEKDEAAFLNSKEFILGNDILNNGNYQDNKINILDFSQDRHSKKEAVRY